MYYETIWLVLLPLALVTYPMLYSANATVIRATDRPNGVNFGKY